MDHYSNAMTFSLSILINACYYANITLYPIISFTVLYYVYDLKRSTNIFRLHHTLAILLSIFYFQMEHNGYNQIESNKTIISIESTTPIFVLCLYLNNQYLKILFFCMFFKCRVLTQYNLLSLHPEEFIHYPIIGYTAHAGLFAINLYWFGLMCKQISKPLFNNSSYILICHKVSSYIYFGNLFICYYMYQQINPHLLTTYMLSISNYIYQQKVCSSINKSGHYTKDIEPWAKMNNICIHLASLSMVPLHYIKYSFPLHCLMCYRNYNLNYLNMDTFTRMYLFDIMFLDINIVFKIMFIYLIEIIQYLRPLYNMSFILSNIVFCLQTYMVCSIKAN
jgi:hypothetical protein